jgi:hypothetical protein
VCDPETSTMRRPTSELGCCATGKECGDTVTRDTCSIRSWNKTNWAVPKQKTGNQGPVWEQTYSSTLSLTSALDHSGSSTPRSSRFTPRERNLVPILQDAG